MKIYIINIVIWKQNILISFYFFLLFNHVIDKILKIKKLCYRQKILQFLLYLRWQIVISVTSLLHRPIIIYHLKNISPFTFFFSQEKSHSGFWFFFFFGLRWLEIILLLTPQLQFPQTHKHPACWEVSSCLQGQFKISNLNLHKVKSLTNYRYKLIRKLGNYNLRQRKINYTKCSVDLSCT